TLLGLRVYTHTMRVGLPQAKLDKLKAVLAAWPGDRQTAYASEIHQLAGYLQHVLRVVRPGRYFVWPLLRLTGL
ncbi:unnamed protein product, partial [Discosporangium mesarthrocarpum]